METYELNQSRPIAGDTIHVKAGTSLSSIRQTLVLAQFELSAQVHPHASAFDGRLPPGGQDPSMLAGRGVIRTWDLR